jgi:ribosomal protein S10
VIKNLETTKRHILVELRVKGYTEFFLTNFIKFLKQRFFKNFIKLGNTTLIFNKYTLLRSAFINKSSREQIEKRISINKINFIFSESDFKFFYSTLNSLNFKGVSLKISKFYFF